MDMAVPGMYKQIRGSLGHYGPGVGDIEPMTMVAAVAAAAAAAAAAEVAVAVALRERIASTWG